MAPLRIMLDTMIFDKIVEIPGMTDDLRTLVAAGKVDIVTTHVQDDELEQVRNSSKHAGLARIPCRRVPTAVFVFDVSRLGLARLGAGEEGGLRYERLRMGNPKHTRDAIIALTAAQEADVLVSEDRTLSHRTRASAETLEVWDFAQFSLCVTRMKKECWLGGASFA